MPSVDVLVIGAGPVGLTAAALLGDLGVDVLVVDGKPSTSTHARAIGIHPRTMEVWRRLGAADAVRSAAVDPARTAGIGWLTTMSGAEVGRLMFPPPGPPDVSPEQGCFCGQHRYEAVLRSAAAQRTHVHLRFGWKADGPDNPADPRVRVVNALTGATDVITPRFVIAADGLHSQVRRRLGVTETALDAFGHSVNVHFRADLRRHRTDRPFALTWTVGPGVEGTFGVVSSDEDEWTFNLDADPAHEYSTDELVAAIRCAVGEPTLDVDIIDTLRWDYDAAVTDHWRRGRVFFSGDAAHHFPPHGGFGMNSGVQDAENLAWKIAAVLRWGASGRLLDTYEVERKPVAEFNVERALINTRALTDSPEAQAEHFLTLGQQMGAVYQSAAVVPDGAAIPQSTVSTYAESGSPGARAPHVMLRRPDGTTLSTIDLCRRGFAALVGRTNVREDSGGCTTPGPAPVVWATVGPGGHYRAVDRSWADVYGVGPDGGVLIRPDGHIAARFPELPPDPRPSIDAAVHAILSSDGVAD